MFTLKGIIANLLFLVFNLAIFYAMYWAYKKDSEIVKEEKRKKRAQREQERTGEAKL